MVASLINSVASVKLFWQCAVATVTEAADIHMVDEMTNGISQNKDNGIFDDSTHQIYSPRTFDCVVVGGGQAGLSTGGRLKALGVTH